MGCHRQLEPHRWSFGHRRIPRHRRLRHGPRRHGATHLDRESGSAVRPGVCLDARSFTRGVAAGAVCSGRRRRDRVHVVGPRTARRQARGGRNVNSATLDAKLILIADPHLVCPDPVLHGKSPGARLQAVIAHINEYHADAEMCIILGDLAHGGRVDEYRYLEETLAGCAIPYRLIPGNHDIRGNMLAVFDGTRTEVPGFIMWAEVRPYARLVFLDTVQEGRSAAAFCERRLAWLRATLDASQEPLLLMLHHPPLALGFPRLDPTALDSPELEFLLHENAHRIKLLAFGHVHRSIAGQWLGIPICGLWSCAHQHTKQRQSPCLDDDVRCDPPWFGIVRIAPDATTFHLRTIELDALARCSARVAEA
ncbi:hypothetical protein D8B24_20565 [Verminephrobacter aporrectodeae subsp. tuberculatae]|nr:hypothetical protein [Verminephrobacter aporrectodeae subsp. tuberculatae]